MSDTASLKISVNTSEVKTANTELDKLSKTSARTEQSNNKLSNSNNNLSSSFLSLNKIISATALSAVAIQAIKTSDEMNNLQARIKLVTSESANLHKVQSDLVKIANQNKVGIQEVSKLYIKLADPVRQLGGNLQTTLDITNSFSKALLVSGASTAEAASSLLQFSQAMGSGVLRGDEFNSIAEASPRILKAVADSLGVAQGALREMAAEGKLTAGIVGGALLRSMVQLEAEAISMPNTVSGAFQVLKNNVSDAISKFDDATNTSSKLAGAIQSLNFDVDNFIDSVKESEKEGSAWIQEHEKGIGVFERLGTSIFNATGDIAGFIAKQSLLKVSAIGGAVLDVAGLFETDADRSTAAINKKGEANRKNIKINAEILAIEEKINNLDKPAEQLKKAEAIDKRREALLAYAKAQRISLGITDQEQLNKLVSAKGKEYDAEIKAAEKLEASSARQVKAAADKKAAEDKVKSDAKKAKAKSESDAKKAEAEADKIIEEAAKKEREIDHKLNQAKLSNIQKITDEQKEAILNAEDAETESQLRRGEFIRLQQEALLSDKEKLNRDYLSTWEQMEAENAALIAQGLEPIFNTDQMQTFFSKWQESIEGAKGGYNDTLNLLDEISKINVGETISFTATGDEEIDKISSIIEGLGKVNDMHIKQAETEKRIADERKKIDEDQTKSLEDKIKLNAELDKKQSQLTKNTLKNEVASAGRMISLTKGVFKEKTTAYKVLSATEKTVNAASVAMQTYDLVMNSEFIASLFAKEAAIVTVGATEVATNTAVTATSVPAAIAGASIGIGPTGLATGAAMVAFLAAMGLMGGSSGGGGGVSSPSEFDVARTDIENNYTPMTDRLDRQIELLEAIDKNGSASQLGIELAKTSFQRDYALWVEDTLESMKAINFVTSDLATTTEKVSQLEKSSGVNVYKDPVLADYHSVMGSGIQLNTDVLRENFNLLNTLRSAYEMNMQLFGDAAAIIWSDRTNNILEVSSSLNEAQNLIHEWSMGVISSMDDLKDASSDFKEYFDDITGSMYYETNRLSKAFDDVRMLQGGNSFADYLQTNIKEIDALQEFFTDETVTLLLSDSFDDIHAQIEAINKLSAITGLTFENGAKEALNYLESIQLVAEAMATSRENINSFIDPLLSTEEKAQNLADSMGISLAKNVDELAQLFNTLAYDAEGLTNSELELLNTNKDLIENTDIYNDKLEETSKSISTLESALSTITTTIEKLRSASRTSEQNLQVFYEAMAEAQRLSKTDDYAAYAEAVKKAADTSSALLNKDNFALSRDMEYAQLVAANQFEDLGDVTLTQVDILKQIEENTRLQVSAITEAMNNLGMSINTQLRSAVVTSTADKVQDIYSKYDLHKYQTDTSGYKFWEQAVSSGALTLDKLDAAIKASAEEVLGVSLSSFAVGTPNVPYDMIANIHKGETIVPAPFADGLRSGSLMMGNNTALVNELRTNNSLLSGIITKQDQQIQVLLESRDIQNGSLVELENIGVII